MAYSLANENLAYKILKYLTGSKILIFLLLQLQVEPISKKYEQSKYRGVFQAVRLICREETIFALWKGHVSAQVLSIIYGISQVKI